jgi:hypothetical protein
MAVPSDRALRCRWGLAASQPEAAARVLWRLAAEILWEPPTLLVAEHNRNCG